MSEAECVAALNAGIGGGRAGPRSAGARRDGHRQHRLGRGDLRRAVRRAGGLVDRARHRPRPRTASPTRPRWSGAASCAMPARSATRSRSCAGSAGARSRRWPARSSPRASGASRCCSTASSPAPRPRCSRRSSPPRSTTSRAAHRSAEPGHPRLLERLGLRPLLDLDMRLGEASGAALAILLCRAALACHTGMATFASAGVSGRG